MVLEPETIIALCSAGGAAGGALGAWITVRVTVAVHGQRLNTHDKEIGILLDTRNSHTGLLSGLSARVAAMERNRR